MKTNVDDWQEILITLKVLRLRVSSWICVHKVPASTCCSNSSKTAWHHSEFQKKIYSNKMKMENGIDIISIHSAQGLSIWLDQLWSSQLAQLVDGELKHNNDMMVNVADDLNFLD